MNYSKSIAAFANAQQIIPGGVNSPARAFKSVNTNPVYIDKAYGAKIWDIDGNEYIDYICSWGPLILGHAHPEVVDAIQAAAARGTSYGAPTNLETDMAQLIVDMVPSIEVVRMVNSGTEATMSALRLARGYTGRELVIKFEGCYHGHADSFLIKAGSGALTLGHPDSPGVTKGTAKDTLVASFNDLESVQALFEQYPGKIAAVIVEPVAGNMGAVPPKDGFLQGLRDITSKDGALLIFDEVMTGFRLAKGGAQEVYKVMPDITTLGKIIGGGLPVGAYGASKEIMDHLAPTGPVYQAGTLSGNPLAMAAGYATLKILNQDTFYDQLEEKSARLQDGIQANLAKTGVKGIVNRVGSMMTLFFTPNSQVTGYPEASQSDTNAYANYFKMTLDNGISLAPSQFECAFVSAAHTIEDIDHTIEVNLKALENLAGAAN